MKKLIILFCLTFAAVPTVAFPQDGGTEVTVPDTSLTNPSTGEVIEDVTGVVDKATKFNELSERSGKLIAIAAILAAAFKLLLSLLKLASGFFRNKNVPKIGALVLGLLTYVFSALALQMPWYEALLLAASGPGAIVFNELLKFIPSIRRAKDAQNATTG